MLRRTHEFRVKLSYRPKELPPLTGIGEGRIYRLIAEGQIKSIMVGHRIIVPAWALEEFLRKATSGD
jgi:excisionase family DNA binding protein